MRWFDHLYLATTTALRDYRHAGKPKAAPFLERLDVFFGNAVFDALDAADGVALRRAAGRRCSRPALDGTVGMECRALLLPHCV